MTTEPDAALARPAPARGAPAPLAVPVVVFAFARPDYLARLLASLRRQAGHAVPEGGVHLLQDGGVSPRTGLRYAEEAAIAASVAAFREAFPKGQVHAARHNLGVAMNLQRGETLAFERLGAEVAYFFEDDLELGPHYLAAMERLRGFAAEDPRIGYFAAYGNHRAEADPARPRIVPLEHHWGFGLTRACWRAMQPWLAPFRAIWERVDYQARPHLRLVEQYLAKSVASTKSSQDVAKTLACAELGFARINTDACHARYIGAQGQSFREASFSRLGYDRMGWVEAPPEGLAPPAAEEVSEIIAQRRRQHGEGRDRLEADLAGMRQRLADPDRPATREEIARLWWLLLDRLPDDPAYYDRVIAAGRTVREVRNSLLRGREARGKTPFMLVR